MNTEEIESKLTTDIYDIINENVVTKKEDINSKINLLFKSKYVYPIVEDFLRYHKVSENYEIKKRDNKFIDREQTRIKYIINKINKIKSF